jgi:uncharacterized protein YkwD
MHQNISKITFWYICPLLLAGILFLSCTSLSRGSDREKTGENITSTEQYILESINRIRREHHLSALSSSPALQQLARDHSRFMAESAYLGHDQRGLDFKARIERAHLAGWREVGENVGRSLGYRNNADTIIVGWMESKPHRKNILTAGFNMTGIGTAIADDGTLYATQIFMGTDKRK